MSVTITCGSKDMEVASVNFRLIADALGICSSYAESCGSMTGSALRDACKAWQSKLEFDAGVEPTMKKGGIVIDSGRRRGYLNIKVQMVLDIAEKAIADGVEVDFY